MRHRRLFPPLSTPAAGPEPRAAHTSTRRSARARTGSVLVAATLLLAVGCSSDQQDPGAGTSGAGTTGADASGAAGGTAPSGSADVPEECAEVYPFAFEDPDLGDVELLPADFPDPPVPATLCETGGAGAGQEYAAYATTAGGEEVLAAYEDALSGYGARRDEDGLGSPIVTASLEDVAVQVSTKEGGFSIVLTRG